MRLLGAAAPKTVEGTTLGNATAALRAAAPWNMKSRRLKEDVFFIG
jgi:hypothetical protein